MGHPTYPLIWYRYYVQVCTATRTCLALFNVQEGLWLQVIPRLLPSVAHHPQVYVWYKLWHAWYKMWHMYGTKSAIYGSKCSTCMVQWVLYYGTCKVQNVGSHVRSLQLSWAAVSLVFGLHPNSDPGCSGFRNEDDDCLMQSHEKVREGRGIAELIRNNR